MSGRGRAAVIGSFSQEVKAEGLLAKWQTCYWALVLFYQLPEQLPLCWHPSARRERICLPCCPLPCQGNSSLIGVAVWGFRQRASGLLFCSFLGYCPAVKLGKAGRRDQASADRLWPCRSDCIFTLFSDEQVRAELSGIFQSLLCRQVHNSCLAHNSCLFLATAKDRLMDMFKSQGTNLEPAVTLKTPGSWIPPQSIAWTLL